MEQCFLWILNNAIIVSFLIVAVCILRFVFRKAPRRIICILWVVVAIKLMLPIQIESAFSLIPNSKPIPVSITAYKEPTIESGIMTVDKKINTIIQNNFSTKEINSVNPMQVFVNIGKIVWLLGFFGIIVYAVISYILLKKELRISIKVKDNIYVCDYISSPFILGIKNPKIYYPSNLSNKEIEYVMKHEQAHLKRMDHLWKPLGLFLLAIYWFNPLCWVAYILMCKDIEYACDEKATAGEEKYWKSEYCQTLLNCSTSRKMISVCPIAFGENSVKGRVRSIMNYKKAGFWLVCLMIVSFVGVSICFVTTQKKNDAASNKQISQNEDKNAPKEIVKGSERSGSEVVANKDKTKKEVKEKGDSQNSFSSNLTDVKIDYANSSMYSEEDMNDAIQVILKEFNGWKGCELHSVSYGSDEDCMGNLEWMQKIENANDNKEKFDECIMFKSDFHSPKNEEDCGGLNPDYEYTDYQWWLARSKGGEWKLMTWGY